MAQLEQTYGIKAPAAKVWQALIDAGMAEQWGAGPANIFDPIRKLLEAEK